jgi:hypothetical protein
VARQELLAIAAGDERGDLRRQEPRELRPLALDGLEQSGVPDTDRGLVRERRREPDRRGVER